MRLATMIATLASIGMTVPALAWDVPEVSSSGSLAAITAVAALALIVWERRHRA
jgi:hypothetical protein